MSDEPYTVIQHLHCPVCNKAIPPDEDYCGEECKEIYERRMKKKRFISNLFNMVGIFIIILLVLSFVGA